MNVIDRARERIERDGWWRENAAAANPGGVCLMNSVYYECGSDTDAPEYVAARAAIQAELAVHNVCQVYAFNDDPSTSLEDVLLVMKRASARLDEGASRWPSV